MLLGLPLRACCKAMARKGGRGGSREAHYKAKRTGWGENRGKRIETVKEGEEIYAHGGMGLDSQHSSS